MKFLYVVFVYRNFVCKKKNFWYVDNMYIILRLLDWVEYDKVLNS